MKDNGLTYLSNSDLHSHMGACVSPKTLWEIAMGEGLSLPSNIKNYWDFIKCIKSTKNEKHESYLNRFQLTQFIQSSPYAMEKSVYHAVSYAYTKCNITTLELRFNPFLRNRGRGTNYDIDSIIMSAIIGLNRATLAYPIRAGLIIETDRTFTEDMAIIAAEKAVKYKNMGIIGFDCSGHSPKNFKVNTFVEAFNIARKSGLGLTFHTGEVTDADEMMEIMKIIQPHRIGHGIKCVNDKKLMALLKDRGTVLEICPTSNLRLGIIKDIDELHKILDTLVHNKVKFCINSDGPVFLNVSVNDELVMLYQNKIFNGEEIEQLVRESHDYTFIKDR